MKKKEMIDLSTEFLGFKLNNPLALTEGPLSNSLESINRAVEAGVGIIFTKGVQPNPAKSFAPYIVRYDNSLLNADWTDIGFDAWLDVVRNVGEDVPLVVSISNNYSGTDRAIDMAKSFVRAGARAVSFVDYDPYQLINTVRQARKLIKVPIMVKLTPFLKNIEEILKALMHAGIDAIAAMDSVGPVLAIDYETGEPLLGSQDGSAYLSGKSILSITLKYIYEISRYVDVPVMGVGGVTDYKSAIQMLMAGATIVGMVTAPMLKGLNIYRSIVQDLIEYMRDKNEYDLSKIRGITHKKIEERIPVKSLYMVIDKDSCEQCGLCKKVCSCCAIDIVDEIYVINSDRCACCGLCQSVCPKNAIYNQK